MHKLRKQYWIKRISCNKNRLKQMLAPLLLIGCLNHSALAAVCSINAIAVNFGPYNVYATSNPGTQGQITVSCVPLTTYTIALNGGTFGTIAQRKMRSNSTSELMLYNLYTNAAHTTLWGDGTSNGVTVTSSAGTPNIVYGDIPPLQDVSIGTYSDDVAITVTF